jgi:hypothetical protein
MRRLTFGLLCLALGLALAPPAAAQRRGEPQLLLTLFGGLSTGGQLWDISRQPFGRRAAPTTFDTLRLSRSIEPALTIGANATIFPRANLGLSGEIVFMGFGVDDGCTMVYTNPSLASVGENDQICVDISNKAGSASTIGFYLGGIYRVATGGFASPYLSAQAGITTRTASTVELEGRFLDALGTVFTRAVIDGPTGSSVRPSGTVGLGVMLPVASGYQVRLELRDNLLLMDAATGPAQPVVQPDGTVLQLAPTTTKLLNSFALVFKLDIVLERKRGRRY